MPTYVFKAIDKTGQMLQGKDEAQHVGALSKKLRARDLNVLSIREERDWLGHLSGMMGRNTRLPLFPVMVVMRQLATMIKAGIPIVKTLENLSKQGLDWRVDQSIEQMQKDVCSGYSFAQAFENQGNRFPVLAVPLIKAGEISGNLDEMLMRLAEYLEKDLAMKRAWKQASFYPLVVFTFCCLLTVGTVSYIFPIFINLFRGLSVELPLSTRALITITESASNPTISLPVVMALLFGFLVLRQFATTPVGRRQLDQVLLELPYLGGVLSKMALSRVARTLATMLASGVSTLVALKIAGAASDNSIIRDALERVASELKEGGRLAEILAQSGLFPAIFTQMVEAGEQSGRLPDMLLRLGDFFEDEVMAALAAFTSLIEPIMIGAMGLLVLFVLVAVFQPIYLLMGSV